MTGLIQMGAGAGTTVLTVVPETVLEEDFLNLAIRVWEFRMVFAIPRFIGSDKEQHIKVVLQRFELFAGPVKAARIWPKGYAPTERK